MGPSEAFAKHQTAAQDHFMLELQMAGLNISTGQFRCQGTGPTRSTVGLSLRNSPGLCTGVHSCWTQEHSHLHMASGRSAYVPVLLLPSLGWTHIHKHDLLSAKTLQGGQWAAPLKWFGYKGVVREWGREWRSSFQLGQPDHSRGQPSRAFCRRENQAFQVGSRTREPWGPMLLRPASSACVWILHDLI